MSPTKSANGLTSYQHGDGNETSEPAQPQETTNEYVLGVAFWTFLLFLIAEAFFAVIAGSQAMLEDAEAMTVDALTYLFNLAAERVKNRPYTEEEKRLPPSVLDYRRERLRLYLEVIPPLISVATLGIVTVLAIKDALESLAAPKEEESAVNVNLMIIFSAGNMLLDIVNVGCFAKAHQAYGLSTVKREPRSSYRSARNMELEGLLQKDHADNLSAPSEDSDESEATTSINLNMCSAWTVSGMVPIPCTDLCISFLIVLHTCCNLFSTLLQILFEVLRC
jgi:Co/Zn/Cd efflux system component